MISLSRMSDDSEKSIERLQRRSFLMKSCCRSVAGTSATRAMRPSHPRDGSAQRPAAVNFAAARRACARTRGHAPLNGGSDSIGPLSFAATALLAGGEGAFAAAAPGPGFAVLAPALPAPPGAGVGAGAGFARPAVLLGCADCLLSPVPCAGERARSEGAQGARYKSWARRPPSRGGTQAGGRVQAAARARREGGGGAHQLLLHGLEH